ncbi:MAG: prepilin-type N-terminal cleavage/methylation domain-containing protein [Candidatus Omnitrophica bacterium]|nr:prepilin-type N-terminal cleavage/methylation domain-containing protein [Candidatus Omnitrophota bacterium]
MVNGLRCTEKKKPNPPIESVSKTIHYPLSAIRCDKTGLTLVELLLVSALLAVIALSAYSVFSSGIKIWMGVTRLTPYEDINIFFDKLSTDIRNAFMYNGIGFLGERDKFEFATLVTSSRMEMRTVGKVIYSYDSMGERLTREERDYSRVYDDDEGLITESLANVNSLSFSYYAYDDTIEKHIWKDSWQSDEKSLPLAVRITLEIKDERQSIEITRTISIPTGGKHKG